ncbi:hypothetical protein P170DRAFT_30097 [Aspergillus steynii IBT 23096]|uniref:Uncharacterized protein n=1 Tax=Aspergillus steynii IBT 23096 TaxID=1392250 RepID=A0A2I2GQ80_9EURO|nr:uncharacterized protein P170DRAFT_30097 [Aspergillus steynii IBT 23096]PLB55028.1 hypothetical protein P170DRAFT_30097 [Aspergillus steynii IBT 23096]
MRCADSGHVRSSISRALHLGSIFGQRQAAMNHVCSATCAESASWKLGEPPGADIRVQCLIKPDGTHDMHASDRQNTGGSGFMTPLVSILIVCSRICVVLRIRPNRIFCPKGNVVRLSIRLKKSMKYVYEMKRGRPLYMQCHSRRRPCLFQTTIAPVNAK